MNKATFVKMYILITEETYTKDFKKIVKLIKDKIVSSTLIIRKFDYNGNHVDILVEDNKFLVVS